MLTRRFFKWGTMLGLLLIIVAGALPLYASPPQTQCFDIATQIGQGTATWTSDGLVDSSGTATFTTNLAGTDPQLGIPATVHHFFTFSDQAGTITMRIDGKSALVTDHSGTLVPGFTANWTIISGTGTYADLHGHGDGYGWPEFQTRTFWIYQCGQAEFAPFPAVGSVTGDVAPLSAGVGSGGGQSNAVKVQV